MTVPEARVWFDHSRQSWCVLVLRGDGQKTYVAKSQVFEYVEAPEPGVAMEPTFVFYGHDGEAILRQIIDALAKNGVKDDSDAKIAGTLEATRYHLEDLRTALKNQGILHGAK